MNLAEAIEASGFVHLITGTHDEHLTDEQVKRVVACLKACAGISTDRLEEYVKNGGLSKVLWKMSDGF